jgi:putative ABC transport system ATP-binding protein
MTELAIEVKDLEFAWPCKAAFLRVPTLSLQQGQTLFVGGRSGSGKTTLLSLLTGVHSVQKGVCKVLDHNLTEMSASQRDLFRGRNLGLVFQQFNLIPYLTVQENIELPTQIFASRAQHAIDLHGSVTAQVHSLCDSLHLSRQLMARPAHQLSVGEQQRVASARALMGSPALIIADEPTSALDEESKANFMTLLLSTAQSQNASVIAVSHDTRLADQFDHRYFLSSLENQSAVA